MFLLGTATTFAGAFLAACGSEPAVEVAAADVPVGSATIFDGFIIAQPTEGTYVAYSQTCPHQRNPITEVEGDTVRDLVKMDGPMELERALGVMADVCGALDFSHRKGIIHRDVKPANIMISRDGAVKVMDFGIARALEDTGSLTQTQSVVGTAQYLSPEQARGEVVDAQHCASRKR